MRETLSLDLVRDPARGRAAGRRGGTTAAELTRFEIASGDEVFGEIGVEGTLGEDEESFLRAIANVLATALGRLRGEERMRHEALHDPLTGLANRALCRERLIHALARTGRDQGGACVLFIDLDDFKAVNDLYGHAAGDALLIALAPPAGGHGPPGGHRRAAGRGRVRGRVRGHRRAHGDRARPPPGGGDPRAAGRGRDRAPAVGVDRDRAGRRGPARPGRAARRRRRRRLPREGRGAGARGGLRHARCASTRASACGRRRRWSGRCRSGSCGSRSSRSCRWRTGPWSGTRRCCAGTRPGGVMSAPADFIPVAEESALIVEIGAWTLMQACHESAAAFGLGEDGPAIWVNLSPRQLAQPDLPALVADCLRSSGLPPAAAAAGAQGDACCRGRRRRRGATSTTLRELGVGLGARRLRHGLLLAARPAGARR